MYCDDMYCRSHNPERVQDLKEQGIIVGKNSKGCGRRIDWKYWKQVKPKLEKLKI